jgi:hypothetical protein
MIQENEFFNHRGLIITGNLRRGSMKNKKMSPELLEAIAEARIEFDGPFWCAGRFPGKLNAKSQRVVGAHGELPKNKPVYLGVFAGAYAAAKAGLVMAEIKKWGYHDVRDSDQKNEAGFGRRLKKMDTQNGTWKRDGSPSKYRITESADGFSIEGHDRPRVTVGMEPYFLWVSPGMQSYTSESSRNGLFEFHTFVTDIARGLLRNWQGNWKGKSRGERDPWGGAREWAINQTSKAICKRVHAQWSRLLGKADPSIAAVQRAIFAATRECPKLAKSAALYQNPYVVRDICNYRAAAIVAAFLRDDHIDVLSRWMDVYSPTDKSYGPLRATLMNLPGGVSPCRLTRLRYVQLPRPITNRLELAFITAGEPDRWLKNNDKLALVLHASEDEIKVAMRRLSEHLHRPLSHRKTRDIWQLTRYLLDCPEPHSGRLSGWLTKSIHWHDNCRQEEIDKTLRFLGGAERKTHPPCIPLPAPDIRFLNTVGEICEEGERMQHCVASYAVQAVAGRVYLFHIDHKGESATVAVNRHGLVEQAQGPRNSENNAVTWGTQMLRKWGKELNAAREFQPPSAEQVFDLPMEEIPF